MEQKESNTTLLDISIPQSVENLLLPDPALLQFYRNYENRILWIDNEVTDITLEYAKMIMQWNFEDAKNNIPVEERVPIKIVIFSPGGDLDVNNCLVDTISLSKTKVIGINAGNAYSSGFYIFLACHERYAFPTSQFLIHQGAGTFSGSYDVVVSAIMNYQRQIEELGKFVLSRSSIPEDVFYENFSSDWYLNAKEALDYDVVHKIINSLDEIIINK